VQLDDQVAVIRIEGEAGHAVARAGERAAQVARQPELARRLAHLAA